MTGGILGLPLDMALAALRESGIDNPEITETRAPRRGPDNDAGNLRVIRMMDGGARVLVARFPDEVERDV